jgi:hypothetical protein
MKRAIIRLLVAGILVATAGEAFALPAGPTIPWAQVPGEAGTRVRAVEIVNGTIWLGGKFSSITDRSGTTRPETNLAAINAATGNFEPFDVPDLPGEVWDMDPQGAGVVVAGIYTGPGGRNLAHVSPSGTSWFASPPSVRAVLVTASTVYAGNASLSAWDATTRSKMFSGRARLTTDPSLRSRNTPPAYRDFVVAGGAIYAACACDTAGGAPSKAMIKLDAAGNVQPFTLGRAGVGATGISVASDGTTLYLAAGGTDFGARYRLDGSQLWKRDTSGSAQTVELHEGLAVFGGHFTEVSDAVGDNCGSQSGVVDPNDECQTRPGLAAYSLDGSLQAWRIDLTGRYNRAWAIEPEGSALHVAGEFTRAAGVRRANYAKMA